MGAYVHEFRTSTRILNKIRSFALEFRRKRETRRVHQSSYRSKDVSELQAILDGDRPECSKSASRTNPPSGSCLNLVFSGHG